MSYAGYVRPVGDKQADFEGLFREYSGDSETLGYEEFSRLFSRLTGKLSRENYAIFFMIADENFKGYLTRKDWLDFIGLFNESNSQFKMIWKFFSKLEFSKQQTLYEKWFKNGGKSGGDNDGKNDGKNDRLMMTQFMKTLRKLDDYIHEHKFQQKVHYVSDDGINWAKINSMLDDHYSRNAKYVDYHDLNNLIISELNHEKVTSFFHVHKNANIQVEASKVAQLVDHLYGHKIDSRFLQFVLSSHRSDYSWSDIKSTTNLLNKYLLINKLLLDTDHRSVESSKLFTDHELDILHKYIHSNGSSSAAQPADIASNIAVDIVAKRFDKSHNLYSLLQSVYHFCLGAVSGAIGATMVYPIDLIKTRIQAQRNHGAYRNSLDCLVKTVAKEGPFKLYSGLVPQLVGIAPEKAIKLTMNDLVRSLSSDLAGHVGLPYEILAGSCAGGAQVVFTNPLEIVKIRLQIQGQMIGKLNASGQIIVKKSAMEIVRLLGISGLYKGVAACLLRDVPFSSIYFPTYAHLKQYFINANNLAGSSPGPDNISTWQLLTAGAVAGMPAAYLTTPCDVIKTRLQLESKKGDIQYKGIADAARKIYKYEGFSAFFKGGPARILRSSPQFGFTLASYEILQKFVPFDWTSNMALGWISNNNVSNDSIAGFSKNTLNSDFHSLNKHSHDYIGSSPNLYWKKSAQTLDLFKDISPNFQHFDYTIYQCFKNQYGSK